MLLKGKTALIAGGSQGLGIAIAEAYLAEGANILVCARDKIILEQAHQKLKKASSEQRLLSYGVDISYSDEVHQMFELIVKEFGGLDILVNCAAIQGPMGTFESQSYDEWSKTIDINLKGVFNLCRFAVPEMKKNNFGKIILLSGGGATKARPYFSAYAASKVAVVRFAETIAEELLPFHIDVNTIAPGVMNTRLVDEMLAAGPEIIGREYNELLQQKNNSSNSIQLSTSLAVFLGSSLSNGITGRLISSKWDPWQEFPNYIEKLQISDVYKLRRIMPEDRSLIMEMAK